MLFKVPLKLSRSKDRVRRIVVSLHAALYPLRICLRCIKERILSEMTETTFQKPERVAYIPQKLDHHRWAG